MIGNMEFAQYQWEVKVIQDRYQYLAVSFEQAEEIFHYEQVKNTYSEKYHFSQWEEFDFELTSFKEILSHDQFISYEKIHRTAIEQCEQSLREADEKQVKTISYVEDLINFYETQFLPAILAEDHFLFASWLHFEKAKVDYLKEEYSRFLNDSRTETLVNHFRYNRTFMPNELKASLLRHKLSCILPNYASFKCKMDKPTKGVANYLETKLKYLPEESDVLIAQKVNELQSFNELNFKKFYGDISGWHTVTVKSTLEEKKEHLKMAILLLDRNRKEN